MHQKSSEKEKKINSKNKGKVDTFIKIEINLTKLVRFASKRWCEMYSNKLEIDLQPYDFISIAYLQAIFYQKDIRDVEAFLKVLIVRRITDALRKNQARREKNKSLQKDFLMNNLDNSEQSSFTQDKIEEFLVYLYPFLNHKEKNLLELRIKGLTWKQVANEIGISHDNARKQGSRLKTKIKYIERDFLISLN